MSIYERPRWSITQFDPVTGAGRARGVGEVAFVDADARDLEPGEDVFVTLADMSTARSVWPSVAHWPLPRPEVPQPRREVPAWASQVTQTFDALPYPLPATWAPGEVPAFIAFDATPNAYAPCGADLHVMGELQLLGIVHVEGELCSGNLAGRVASGLERAWLSSRTALPDDIQIIALAEAGRADARSNQPVLCALRSLRWVPHAWQQTQGLEKALGEQWELHRAAPERLTHDAEGHVTARFGSVDVALGSAEAAAARRWTVAWSDFLSESTR